MVFLLLFVRFCVCNLIIFCAAYNCALAVPKSIYAFLHCRGAVAALKLVLLLNATFFRFS